MTRRPLFTAYITDFYSKSVVLFHFFPLFFNFIYLYQQVIGLNPASTVFARHGESPH